MSGLAKERNPMGRVLHDRDTSAKKVPATGVGETTLGHAVKELESQHPHHHSVGGVHHTDEHIRHVPMHSMGRETSHGYSDHMHAGRSHGHPEHKHRDLK